MANVETTRIQFEVEINGEKKILQSIRDVRKERRLLKQQVEAGNLSVTEYNKKVAEIQRLDGILKDHRDRLRGVGNEADKGRGIFAAMRAQIVNTAASVPILGKAIDLLGKGITAALVATGIGAIVAMIGQLINAARAVVGLEKEYTGLREELNTLTGASGEALDAQAAQVKALERTFEVSQEGIIAAGNAAANEFQEGYDVAFTAITKGLQVVGKSNREELLDQTREYSAQFAQAGFDIEQTVGIIANSLNQGVFNDSAADAVKEFGLRITDLSKAQREVLATNFGEEYVSNLTAGLDDGTITVKDALEDVAGEIKTLDEQGRNVQPLVNNLFGGPGENAGVAFIKTLSNINDTLDESIDTTNFYVQQQQQLLIANQDLAEAEAALTSRLEGTTNIFARATTAVKTFALEALVVTIDFFRTLPERIDVVGARLQLFGAQAINVAADIINQFLAPITFAIEKITGIELSLPKVDTREFEASVENASASIDAKLAQDAAQRAEAQSRTNARAAAQDAAAREKQQQEQARRTAENRVRQAEQAAQQEQEARAQAVAKMEEQLQELRIASLEDGQQKELAQVRLQTQRRIDALQGTNEQVAEARRLILDQQAQEEEAIRTKYAEQQAAQEQAQAQERLAQQQQAYENELQLIEQAQQQRILAITQQAVTRVEEGEDPIAVEQDIADELVELERETIERKIEVGLEYGYDVTGLNQELAEARLAQMREEKEQEVEIESEAQAKRRELIQETANAILAVGDLAAAGIDLRLNKEVAALEASKARELELAGDNAEKRTEIEEKFAARQEKLEAEAAKKKQRIAIGEALIRGALAIQRIAADVPKGDFGITTALLIGAQVATTAAQIATIKSQTFARGGFTGPGMGAPDQTGERPAGIVHAGEWVAPRWMVESPAYAPLIGDLERSRTRRFAQGGHVPPPRDVLRERVEIDRRQGYTSLYAEGGLVIDRLTAYNVGGLVSEAPATTPSAEVVAQATSDPLTAQLLERLDALNEGVRQQQPVLVVDDAFTEAAESNRVKVQAARNRRVY